MVGGVIYLIMEDRDGYVVLLPCGAMAKDCFCEDEVSIIAFQGLMSYYSLLQPREAKYQVPLILYYIKTSQTV
jgi:hypothetical protein